MEGGGPLPLRACFPLTLSLGCWKIQGKQRAGRLAGSRCPIKARSLALLTTPWQPRSQKAVWQSGD